MPGVNAGGGVMPLRRLLLLSKCEEDIERGVLVLLREGFWWERWRLRWAVTRARAASGSCEGEGVSWYLGSGRRGRDGKLAGRG